MKKEGVIVVVEDHLDHLVGLVTCLRHCGDCLLLHQVSTIQLGAVCPSPHFMLAPPRLWISLSRCSTTQRKHRPYITPTTSFQTEMTQSVHPFGMLLLSFPFISSLSSCSSLIPFMYIPTVWSGSPFSLLSFISNVWCGCPAEDDLSEQSYYPFGRVSIITMKWCTHLHEHRHENMNVLTN